MQLPRLRCLMPSRPARRGAEEQLDDDTIHDPGTRPASTIYAGRRIVLFLASCVPEDLGRPIALVQGALKPAGMRVRTRVRQSRRLNSEPGACSQARLPVTTPIICVPASPVRGAIKLAADALQPRLARPIRPAEAGARLGGVASGARAATHRRRRCVNLAAPVVGPWDSSAGRDVSIFRGVRSSPWDLGN